MTLSIRSPLVAAALLALTLPAAAQDTHTVREYPYQIIPDNRASGLESQIDVTHAGQLSELKVGMQIIHPRRGDLQVTLVSPMGTRVDLVEVDRSDRRRNVAGVFGLNMRPDGDLSVFNGEDFAGTWTLRVADRRRFGSGYILVWSVIGTVNNTPTQPQPTQWQRFEVVVENISGDSGLATPLAPGAWAVHRSGTPLAADGLEGLAEDGDTSTLAESLRRNNRVSSYGEFNTPDGAQGPGPAMPGNAYRFELTAQPGDKLSLATMLAQTNDAFVASDLAGVDLFDASGSPVDGTIDTMVYDAGTEANEAPGMGPNQAPRQAGPNTGAAEGTVRAYTDSTRSLPLATEVVKVDVTRRSGTYTLRFENVSGAGALVSPFTPVLVANHAEGFRLFTPGDRASRDLERMAEDGDASGLAQSFSNHAGVRSVEVTGNGPVMPGTTVTARVTPSASHPSLSVATMIARTNDAFISNTVGVRLIDEGGNLRSGPAIERELNARLAVWDAGTEQNEAPGVGPNIAPLQNGPNSGPRDSDRSIRRYSDSTNDFLGAVAISVRPVQPLGSFEVTLRNTSDQTGFPVQLSPVVATVNPGIRFWGQSSAAPGVVADLAEDGETQGLISALRGLGVRSAETVSRGLLGAGDQVTFTVTADRQNRFLNLATMLIPTNDAFVALGPVGLELVTARGFVRSEAELAADIASMSLVWDAGSELNEAGGAGPNQPPATHHAGPVEGDGTLRPYDDTVWTLPSADHMVRIRIRPVR